MPTDLKDQGKAFLAAYRAEAEALIREGTRRKKLADEIERSMEEDRIVAVGGMLKIEPTPTAKHPNLSLKELQEHIAKGGTGRAEKVARDLGTTPERIKELVAMPNSGLTTRDRGWVKEENDLL